MDESAYIVRIGDTRELYDASWRRSCKRVNDRLHDAGFSLTQQIIPEDTSSGEIRDVNAYLRRIKREAVMELDYAPDGDFNQFFSITIDQCMIEQLYLAECREVWYSARREVEMKCVVTESPIGDPSHDLFDVTCCCSVM